MNTLLLFLALAMPQFTDTVSVHLATVDAVVTDHSGHQILGLTPDDFTLLVDGEPVEINSLEYYSTRHPIVADPSFRPEPLPGRQFVILIQKQIDGSDFSRMKQVQRDLESFLNSRFRDGDTAAIFTFKSRLLCLSDFTGSRDALLQTVQDRFLTDQAIDMPDWVAPPEELNAQLFIDGLESLTLALERIDGRKDMVLFSYGFGKLNFASIGRPIGDYSTTRQFDRLIEELNSANTAVYILDLHRGAGHTMEAMLSTVADRTGGTYYPYGEHFLSSLKEIEKSTGGYYLLTYYTRTKADEEPRYRSIEVRLANPTFRVVAREGIQY
ncbi:MAG TPA: VWA domain-containing protein [Thermoanaerobaculia bacterium]|nr:VWA domain-containing protein [Thermoanaerobaculia bacterium]HUM29509.1 VWA domain-containing protein [Thermoanaerobaculia bacterium]HXK67892.1 VWA domain-containing protein [Thermoanaerobaculia bacterium]